MVTGDLEKPIWGLLWNALDISFDSLSPVQAMHIPMEDVHQQAPVIGVLSIRY